MVVVMVERSANESQFTIERKTNQIKWNALIFYCAVELHILYIIE